MSITARFTLIVSTLLLILFIMLAWISYLHDKEMLRQENISMARIIARNIIETRDYLSSVARTEEIEKNPALTPQVAATGIAHRLTEGSGYYVRQVSLRFRNPENRPDSFEQEELQKFITTKAPESSSINGGQGKETLRYMIPMVAGETCLPCHGSFEKAPAFVKNRFPEGHPSYNYKKGEIIGAISVSVPLSSQFKSINSNLVRELLFEAAILIITLLASSFLIHRTILAPVAKVAHGIESIALSGNFSSRIEIRSSDEIGRLVTSFNELVSELERRTRQKSESDERYRNFIEIAQSPIVTFLADGKIVIANHKAEKLFGITKDELLGQPIFDFMLEPEPLIKGMQDYFSEGSSDLLGANSNQTMRDICGRLFEVEMVVSVSQTETDAMFTAILRHNKHQ